MSYVSLLLTPKATPSNLCAVGFVLGCFIGISYGLHWFVLKEAIGQLGMIFTLIGLGVLLEFLAKAAMTPIDDLQLKRTIYRLT
jgi:hypothetical protein